MGEVARGRLLRADAEARALLATVGGDLDALADAHRDSATDDEHDPEGTTLAWERSQAEAVRRDAVRRRAAIAGALRLLDEGTYGVCLDCGNLIPAGRLEARPWATLCVRCAERPSVR